MADFKKKDKKFKKVKEFIKIFCNNKYFVAGLIIGAPFLFVLVLKFIYAYVPGEEIGDPGDWISFTGSYLGVIGAVGAVWWQMRKEERDEIKGLLFYIKKILKNNKENYTLEYMYKINSQALSVATIWYRDVSKINLKNFKLEKEDELLLYKHGYSDYIELNDRISKIIDSYYFTFKEENIFFEIFKLYKKNKIEQKSLEQKNLEKEIDKINDILLNLAQYFSCLSSKPFKNKEKLAEIKNQISSLNKKTIERYTRDNEPLKYLDEKFLVLCATTTKKDVKKKIQEIYSFFINIYFIFITDTSLDYENILPSVISKKKYLFSDDYENLISEISEEYEKLEKILR